MELREAAKKLTAPASSGRESWGMSTDRSLKHLADNIWSYGGDPFSSDFRRTPVGEPAAVKALEDYWNLQFIDQVTPGGVPSIQRRRRAGPHCVESGQVI